MKRRLLIFLCATISFGLVACANKGSDVSEVVEENEVKEDEVKEVNIEEYDYDQVMTEHVAILNCIDMRLLLENISTITEYFEDKKIDEAYDLYVNIVQHLFDTLDRLEEYPNTQEELISYDVEGVREWVQESIEEFKLLKEAYADDDESAIKEKSKDFVGSFQLVSDLILNIQKKSSNYLGLTEEEDLSNKMHEFVCEECSEEAEYSITGVSGEVEYYCETHYYEMMEIISDLFSEK